MVQRGDTIPETLDVEPGDGRFIRGDEASTSAQRRTHADEQRRARSRAHRIAKAIEFLRTNRKQPLRIAGLARQLGMSVSGLHHHFKAATGMSPLQFRKQFRLQEARRLLLAGDVGAATAGYRVGYDDASHFSREYRRLFGEPPLRDAERLRGSAASRREPALGSKGASHR
jgi:AraC-like DNA-binding protein